MSRTNGRIAKLKRTRFKGDQLLDSIKGLDSKIESLRPQLQVMPREDSVSLDPVLSIVPSDMLIVTQRG